MTEEGQLDIQVKTVHSESLKGSKFKGDFLHIYEAERKLVILTV